MSAGKFVGEAVTSAVLKLNPFGPDGYARRDRNKAYRKARRKEKRGEPLDEKESQILNQTVEVHMLQGKKTYLGILAAGIGLVLGWVGVGDEGGALSAQIVGALDQVLTVGGLLFAAYGRAKAKPAT